MTNASGVAYEDGTALEVDEHGVVDLSELELPVDGERPVFAVTFDEPEFDEAGITFAFTWESPDDAACATPDAPAAPTVVAGDGEVVVSWGQPASYGFPIVNYTAKAWPSGKTCTVAAPATTCTITGLTNGTSYKFTVSAANSAASGAASTMSTAVSPAEGVTPPSPQPSSTPTPDRRRPPHRPHDRRRRPTTAPLGLTLNLDLNLKTGVVPPGVPGSNGRAPDPRGAEVTVSGHGLMPNSPVVIELHSTPIHLATVTTDAVGSFTTKLKLPMLMEAGLHHVVAIGKAPDGSTVTASAPLVVPYASLPYTGTDSAALAATAVGLVLAGVALLAVSRRRKAVAAGSHI